METLPSAWPLASRMVLIGYVAIVLSVVIQSTPKPGSHGWLSMFIALAIFIAIAAVVWGMFSLIVRSVR